jgi:DNA-binding transcriptional LysR family regulator
MEIKTIRYFIAVAEELHFGRAARRLHISQPPLSRQIGNLERELGCQLFRRTRRSVALTTAGEAFLASTRPLIVGLEDASNAARRAARGEIGRLSIGFFIGATYRLLPDALRVFRLHAPEAEVVFHEMRVTEVPAAIESGRIDIGFLRPPVSEPLIDTEVLLQEPFVAALPNGHPLAHRRSLKLIDLAAERFVMFTPGPSVLYSQILAACNQVGFTPRVAYEAQHPETLLGLVRSGAGIALVASSIERRGDPAVTFRRVTGPLPLAEIAVAWRRNNASPLVQAFLRAARSSRAARAVRKPSSA